MDESVKTFLDKIQEIQDKKVKVGVNSTKEVVDSSPLSFKQQKELISTIADGAVGALRFQKILNQIVIDNTKLNYLTIVDKLPIIVELRINAIGSDIKLDNEKASLNTIFKKIEKLKFQTTKTIGDDFTIELEVPTLAYENGIIQATIDTIKKDSELGKNIGNIYTYEIVKYIKSITFGEDVITFSEIPIKDRVNIVDNLPISTNKIIIEFIQDIKNVERDWLTIDVNGEPKLVEIDVSFFDS